MLAGSLGFDVYSCRLTCDYYVIIHRHDTLNYMEFTLFFVYPTLCIAIIA